MNNNHFLNNLWRWKCNIPEIEDEEEFDISSLSKTEWSSEFETLMRNRLILGAFRYGKLKQLNKPKYDRVGSISKLLSKYNDTGNKEFLVDIANFSLLEFVESNHKNAHFESIDDGEHCVIKLNTND